MLLTWYLKIGRDWYVKQFLKLNSTERDKNLAILKNNGMYFQFISPFVFYKSFFCSMLFVIICNYFNFNLLLVAVIGFVIFELVKRLQCQFLINLINKEILEPESKNNIERLKEKQFKAKQKRAMNLYINKEKI